MAVIPAIARVIDPASRRSEQDQRDQQGDCEEEPRDGRSVRQLVVTEEALVDVQVQEERGAARLPGATVQDERDEEVLEDLDDPKDERVEDDRGQERDRDVPQLTQITRAVDPRGVVQLRRDPTEPGEVDDDATANAPQPHKDEPRVDPRRVAQPVRRVRDADPAQEDVEPAVRRIEHRLPDEDAGDERHDVRQEEQHPEQTGRLEVPAAQ
jgi:hypothetical protein